MGAATKGDFTLRHLLPDDASALASLLKAQSPDYVRFFTPFDFHRATISKLLSSQKQDVFMGIYWQGRLVGFFMLRGWDEGFDVPAYGVLIDEKFSGYGLTTVSLRAVKTICKLSHTPRIMLKVHPANTRARRVFERAGFTHTETDAESGRFIYHFNLNGSSAKI